jgi:hypothetical protein
MPKGLKSLARLLDKVPFAPVVAVLFGLVAAILILATPGWMFERMVVASGLPGLVHAAAPPLGDKARVLAAIVALSAVAGILWFILALPDMLRTPGIPQSRGHRIEPDYDPDETSIRFDALIRRPLFAEADLGAPFMSDEAVAHARDELVLDTLAPDEEAGIAEPVENTVAPAMSADPVEQAQDAQPQQEPDPIAAAQDQRTTSGLLDRLERALERRERRTGSSAPILPGDIEALREALGGSELRH